MKTLVIDGELPFILDNLRFFAAAARSTHGHDTGEYLARFTSIFRREPIGVVAQLLPWNYPLMMAVWKMGVAIAAGCTTILKPAPQTPLTALALAELASRAGLPHGVVNVLSGDDETGALLARHPDVRLVALTGSTEAGTSVMTAAAKNIARVHLELGGKAPFVVLDDADLGEVAPVAAFAATLNSGQDCIAATRVYVSERRKSEMVELLRANLGAVRVAPPATPESQMGPLISREHKARVHGYVERAQRAGACVVCGGATPAGMNEGNYYEPTLVINAEQHSELMQEEVFGPVLALGTFATPQEAIELANDVRYGLSASVWTRDLSYALEFSKKLDYGTVWINDHSTFISEGPHGGVKMSGFGKDLSHEAVREYQTLKHVMIKSPR